MDRAGALHRVRILRLDGEGDGVAEIAGRLVSVPQVIPGEQVEIRLGAGRGGDADLVRVISASPHRVAPPCRHFGPCGGCTWQHIAYAEQLRLKQQHLQRLLNASLGREAPPVLPTLPTPVEGGAGGEDVGAASRAPWHYRNKVHFVFGPGARGRALAMGHYQRRSRTVIPVVECPVHAEQGNRVAFAMHDALAAAGIPGVRGDTLDGVARHLVVRVTEGSDDWLATLVVSENVKPLRRVTAGFVRRVVAERDEAAALRGGQRQEGLPRGQGLYLNIHDRPGPYLFGRETRHLAGSRDIREEVAGVSFVISPTSFFQTNVRAARVLAGCVLERLADAGWSRVLDLYSGVGLFALPLAREGRAVTAVEENREAMAAAAAAARENKIPEGRLRTLPSPVEAAIPRLTPRTGREAWDAVILDPPRDGCPPVVLDWLFRNVRPRRLVYVSCNPDALARDLRGALPAGYRLAPVQPVDMFPHTAHLESVAVLDLVSNTA